MFWLVGRVSAPRDASHVHGGGCPGGVSLLSGDLGKDVCASVTVHVSQVVERAQMRQVIENLKIWKVCSFYSFLIQNLI